MKKLKNMLCLQRSERKPDAHERHRPILQHQGQEHDRLAHAMASQEKNVSCFLQALLNNPNTLKFMG
jgi:hypothetical protein